MSEDGRCPGCGGEGAGDDVLAAGQRWCPTPNEECRVVSFRTSDAPGMRIPGPRPLGETEDDRP